MFLGVSSSVGGFRWEEAEQLPVGGGAVYLDLQRLQLLPVSCPEPH